MTQLGQQLTHATYEDPEVVEAYVQRNALNPKQAPLIRKFTQILSSGPVLDLGCGPGHDSYIFAELGFDVVGLDYSTEMIKRARKLQTTAHPPTFLVGDITKLPEYFADNTFEGIWASASLLHISESEIDQVLANMTRITKPDGRIYVGLKAGEGTLLVQEDRYSKSIQREFILWSKESFLARTTPHGWKLDEFWTTPGSSFLEKPSEWLRFFFRVKK